MTIRNVGRVQVDHRAVLLLTLLLFSLFGFACGTSNLDRKLGTPHRESQTHAPCTNGKPIGARILRDALRRHGFSAQCQGIVGAQVANFTPTAQGAEAARAEHEGSLICGVQRRPIGRMARHPHRVFEYDSLSTHAQPGREIYLANVDC